MSVASTHVKTFLVSWHFQYHIVWVPKYRFRILKGQVAHEKRRKTVVSNAQILFLVLKPSSVTLIPVTVFL